MDVTGRTSPAEMVQIAAQAPRRYRPSRFNAHTPAEDGTLVLYNSFTGNICVLPVASVSDAGRYLSRDGTAGPLDKLGEYLLQKGYIVESTVDEEQRWDLRYGVQQFRPDILELVLLASEECNFRCVYCSQSFRRGTMTPEVRSGIRALVQARAKKLQALRIAWFGGEPLLGWEAIAELAPFFQQVARENDVSFQSDITSNGYLLTADKSRALLDWGVREFQVTLDGTAADHDQHRPLKGSGGTFHRILENLLALQAHPGEYLATIRVNFDNTNVDNLTPLIETVREHFGGDPRFQVRFHPVGKWGGPQDDQLDVCGTSDVVRHLAALRKMARSAGTSAERVAPYLAPIGRNVCFAARPYSFVVGADGKLMKCTEVLDTRPENIVGQLHPDGRLELDEDAFGKWTRPYYKEDEGCRRCFFLPVCQGVICPLPRVVGGDRPCPTQKLEIRQTLLEVWREKMETHQGTSAQNTGR